MHISLIKNKWIISSIVISIFNASVSYAENNMPCPSIDIIQASSSRLDTAQIIKNKYITYTSISVFQSDDLWWFVGVGDIAADTSSEAIQTGQAILKKASIQIDIYATKAGNEYICNYGPGYIQARGKYF